MKQISILGCGWLGYPLALELIKEGFVVQGSTRSQKKYELLQKAGIIPYLINLDPLVSGNNLHQFFQTNILIIAIPPSVRTTSTDFHPNQIFNILDKISSSTIQHCIYISSTVVYPDLNDHVTEETPVNTATDRALAVVNAEQLLQNYKIPITIIRCGGLMGYDRNPVKYLRYLIEDQQSRNKKMKSADTPVNYIHRDDVIGIIKKVIDEQAWDQIFNAVAPKHPYRKEILLKQYPEAVLKGNSNLDSSYKIVRSDKVSRILNYKFKYPDPLSFPFS